MKTAVIMQPTYLPWSGYFDLMDQADIFIFLDSVQFDKRSWQQRNRIKSPRGEQLLTVPVFTKGRFCQKVFEVQINQESNYIEDHLKAIELNYAKTKYFSRYFPEVKRILLKRHERLAELNIELILWFKDVLGIAAETVRSSTLNVGGTRAEHLIMICKAVRANLYLSPEGSRGYIEENNLFSANGIKLCYQSYSPVPYRQLHGEFVLYLSVIDLIMNEGDRALSVIQSGRNVKLHRILTRR